MFVVFVLVLVVFKVVLLVLRALGFDVGNVCVGGGDDGSLSIIDRGVRFDVSADSVGIQCWGVGVAGCVFECSGSAGDYVVSEDSVIFLCWCC